MSLSESHFSQSARMFRFFASWVVPFFLSALFFLSWLFSVFSPLPLFFFYLRSSLRWLGVAILFNSLMVFVFSGWVSSALYFIFVGSVAFGGVVFLIQKQMSINRSVLYSMILMVFFLSIFLFSYGFMTHQSVRVFLDDQMGRVISDLQRFSIDKSKMLELSSEALKKELLVELPSAAAVFALILTWVNFLLLLRLNPDHICQKINFNWSELKMWKAPEFLVWPTILCGSLLIFEQFFPVKWPVYVGLSILRFLMAIYALQGLSILSYYFEYWGLKGFLRTLAYLVVIFLMMPLLLGLGFFDLWFDFRGKIRQL